tara:strand:+ start:285 stop:569 length:285 start_codon:yes stop_codon:yes gene_type:complete
MPVRYPELPKFVRFIDSEVDNLYDTMSEWGAKLISDLQTRDIQEETKPSTNILTVVTVTEIGRPQAGNIVYVAPRGKFVGYVSLGSETSWHDLN